MPQTLREKLALMIEALDAGETRLLSKNARYIITDLVTAMPLSRIPKPPETISGTYADGTPWEINAPTGITPTQGTRYWFVGDEGLVLPGVWEYHPVDRARCAANNCWATEADAQAWADVSKRIRSGK